MHLPSLILLALSSNVLAIQPHPHHSNNYDYDHSSLTDWEQIHQTLHLYPLFIDAKNPSLAPQIFTSSVQSNYSGVVTSNLTALVSFLQASVAKVDSQHLLGTTYISIGGGGKQARSTTYVQARLFAKPQVSIGQVVDLSGKYVDGLVKTGEGWRIEKRLFEFMGPGFSGNVSVLGM